MSRCVPPVGSLLWGSLLLFLSGAHRTLSVEQTGPVNLTILHVNDFHAHFEQFDTRGSKCNVEEAAAGECYGGVARLYTAVSRARQQHGPDLLYLNGGDEYQGTLWFNMFKYEPYVIFLNLLRYDAMALGNHEFDSEVEGLIPLLTQVNFTIVDANIDVAREPRLQGLMQRSKVFTLPESGVKVGVIGYTTTRTPEISQPGENLRFEDEVTSVRREVAVLQSQSVRIIIALGHSGFEIDKKIAEEVDGVDVVVGGHSNTFLYTGTPPSIEVPEGEYPIVIDRPSGERALVVQDYAFAKYLGSLQVSFDAAGNVTGYSGNPILIDNSYEQDPGILRRMKPFQDQINERALQVICYSEDDFSKDSCRERECALGNLMADAMSQWYRKRGAPEDGNVIAITNSGGVRTDFSAGDIQYGDVVATFPFENLIDLYKMEGRHIRQVLQRSADNHGHGAFLMMSGMRVVYDLSRPKGQGQRVVSVQVVCQPSQQECSNSGDPDVMTPLQDERHYVIAMPNFLARGGNGYVEFKNHATIHQKQDFLDLDIILEFLTNRTLRKEEIIDGRISLEGVGGGSGGGSSTVLTQYCISTMLAAAATVILTILGARV